jgi:DNA-binding NtrC family response regulator
MRPTSRASILVVDADTAVLHLMAEILERAGYTVFTAGDPHEALDLLRGRTQEIRLAIVDVQLPRMNGPELAKRLSGLRPGLRVLFVSEYERGALIDTAIRSRGLPLLVKPFSIRCLIQAVEKILQDRWAAAQSAGY